ncbi:hypothetical protein B0H15DRAFT_808492 [Mycena belliarum]|uniref:SHSP domain-containing protein n=1 Tax=Mycena belliarum TaxID=1033014 RepID=A0AAD6UIZ6_9AGAR|nr:hypothetical protein B0H15DRAFT_808492 [Mycena belliae]
MASQPSRIDVTVLPAPATKAIPRRVTSPITPATTCVTGLVFPSPVESVPLEPPPAKPRPLRRTSRLALSPPSSSKRDFVEISPDVTNPPQLDDAAALDDLWNSLRVEKELKMNKERPKVKSLEEYKPTPTIGDVLRTPSPRLRTPSPRLRPPSPQPSPRSKISDRPPIHELPAPNAPRAPSVPSAPTASARTPEKRSLLDDVLSTDRDSFFRTPSPAKAPKKKKSITAFRPSPEKNYVVAIFDLRGVDKDDIRVTYRRDHIMVSWEKWEVEDWEEEDCIARRTVERVYHRVIPLAEGTKFSSIYATMKGEDLLLRYPLVGANGSRSGES